MANIILCDIDGTVADNSHRQYFLEGKKDWDGFFSELVNDLPIQIIIDKVIQEQANGKEIVFLTGRPERYRYSTTLWLKEYFFDYSFSSFGIYPRSLAGLKGILFAPFVHENWGHLINNS